MRGKLILISLIVMITFMGCNKVKTIEDLNGVEVTFKKETQLLVRDNGIGSVRAGETVEVIAENFMKFQIKKKNGDIGWIKRSNMPIGKTAKVGRRKDWGDRSLYSEAVYNPYNAGDKIISEFDKSYDGEEVIILNDMENGGHHWAQIKLPDGKTAWTLVRYLEPFGKLGETASQNRFNGGNLWVYNYNKLLNKGNGKDTKWLVKKYGIPSGKIEKLNGKDFGAYYYENIELFKGKGSGRVVQFEVKDDVIINVNITGFSDGKISAWLPLSKMMRGFGFGNTYRNLPNILFGINSAFEADGPIDKILPGILFIPLKLVIAIIAIALALIYTMLPIFLVTLIVSIRSMNKDVSTGSLILIQGILGVLLGHLWFLFLIYHDSYFYQEPFLAILFLPIIGSSIIAFMMKTLEYNRCEKCNYWGGFGIGSIWLNRHTSTKTTTTKTYKGDILKDTKVNKKTTITDTFKDLRKCANCGHEWSIIREETK